MTLCRNWESGHKKEIRKLFELFDFLIETVTITHIEGFSEKYTELSSDGIFRILS